MLELDILRAIHDEVCESGAERPLLAAFLVPIALAAVNLWVGHGAVPAMDAAPSLGAVLSTMGILVVGYGLVLWWWDAVDQQRTVRGQLE